MNAFEKGILIFCGIFSVQHAIKASCGGILTNSSGIITSPGFPNSYANNLLCDWDITGPVGNKIAVTLTDMDLEHSGNTCFDKIQVYEDVNASMIYELCDDLDSTRDPGISFISTSSFVRIRFTSDLSVTKKGFRANYTVVDNQCRYEINGSSGVVTSPSYGGRYPANSQCVYEFSFPANQRLSVRFLIFDLEKELKDGSCPDFLKLRNKDFIEYGEFCGNDIPPSFSFYHGKARMMFITDKSKNKDGFSLVYSVENITECLQDPKGASYTGQVNVTNNGSACARWDSELAMKNGFSSLLDQENYCRNPNNEARPWCFSAVTQAPEYCNISFCDTMVTETPTTTSISPTTPDVPSTKPSTTALTTSTTKPTTCTTTTTTTTPTTTVKTSSTATTTMTTLPKTTKISEASSTTPSKTNTSVSESMFVQPPQVPTDFLIIIIVVPILLLILIFGIAIALVRFLVKKKKMSVPITQLRSIVNPNYVSKDSVTEGYIEALENDEISRQSIVAAQESVLRMSRKYSRSQVMDSVYYSLEDINGGGTKERKDSKKDESPYEEAVNTYDHLGQRRKKKVDPTEFRTYSEVSIISEGNEGYDHMRSSARVPDDTTAEKESQDIYSNTPRCDSIENLSNIQELKKGSSNTKKFNEVPAYATVRKNRHSSFVTRKTPLSVLTGAQNIRYSTGEKILKRGRLPIPERGNTQAKRGGTEKDNKMIDAVLAVLDTQEKDDTSERENGGSDDAPIYATVQKGQHTKDRKSKLPDPIDMRKIGISNNDTIVQDSEDSLTQDQEKEEPVSSGSQEEEDEEAHYVETDVEYDQLRRRRTRRNKNLGVKVSIYSEILPDTTNDEGIYSNTESANRIIENEQRTDLQSEETHPSVKSDESVENVDSDIYTNLEADIIENSKL